VLTTLTGTYDQQLRDADQKQEDRLKEVTQFCESFHISLPGDLVFILPFRIV